MHQIYVFKTKKEAEAFQKKNGGYICWEERTPKRKLLTSRGKDYMIVAGAMGVDAKTFPYMVQVRI